MSVGGRWRAVCGVGAGDLLILLFVAVYAVKCTRGDSCSVFSGGFGFCVTGSLKQGKCCSRGPVTRLVKAVTRRVNPRFMITAKSVRRFRNMHDIGSPL